MTNINPIRFGIGANQYFKQEGKEDLAKSAEKNTKAAPEAKKSIESGEVLGFMAAQNADLMPAKAKKTIEVSKYVTPEQAARIENFMKGFEADFKEASDIALNEFPDITQETVDGIALAYINSSYAV